MTEVNWPVATYQIQGPIPIHLTSFIVNRLSLPNRKDTSMLPVTQNERSVFLMIKWIYPEELFSGG